MNLNVRLELTDRERLIAESAWAEGALWAAVECGVIRDERVGWLVPADNPYGKDA